MHIAQKIKSHKKKTTLLLLIVDIIFFTMSSPTKMPVYLMVIAFVLVLLSLYVISCMAHKALYSLGYINGRRVWLREGITGFIFLLIIMQSVGQLSGRDVLSLIPIAAVAYFYYSYMGSRIHPN